MCLCPSCKRRVSQGLYKVIDSLVLDKIINAISYDVTEVLPDGYTGKIIDYKIKNSGGKQPDDKVYMEFPYLQKIMPRGLTRLIIEGKVVIDEWVIRGQNKFFGGDNLDDDDTANNFITKYNKKLINLNLITKIISAEKINGCLGHVSGRFLENCFFFVIGSKRVHLLIQEFEDINKFQEERHHVAKKIAIIFFKYLETLSPTQLTNLKNYFHDTNNSIIFEVIIKNDEHVVLYEEQDRMVAIGIIPPFNFHVETLEELEEKNPESLLIPFIELDKLKNEYKMDIVQSEKVEKIDLDEYYKEIALKVGSEGKVLYFINKNNYIVYIEKKKTLWYTLLRAIREKLAFTQMRAIRQKLDFDKIHNNGKKRCLQRIDEIKKWRKIDLVSLVSWKIVAISMFDFMKNHDKTKKFLLHLLVTGQTF